ncbi:TPA: cellulase family glycosylhydrolase [Burkholderia cenocepacia]|nr:cellulase family glycosylhydrolase [Burkholderia cenocepacia]HDV6351167.1 cellulase family glycosylhydrolase [Burkholderia cenocepacia]
MFVAALLLMAMRRTDTHACATRSRILVDMTRATHLYRTTGFAAVLLMLSACASMKPHAADADRADAGATSASAVSHAGRWLIDDEGRVLIVHGVNVVVKQPPYAPEAAGFGAKDMDRLAADGFNAVRLGVAQQQLEPAPGRYDGAYLASLARTQRQLADRRIYTLLDMHQDGYSRRFVSERRRDEVAADNPGGAEINNGFADWMALDDGLPNVNPGHPYYYVTSKAINRAFDHLYGNARGPEGVGLADRFAAAWRHVAAGFAGRPYLLGYELLNEPWPGTRWLDCAGPQGCAAFDQKVMSVFNRTLRNAIRDTDRNTLVFHEPNPLFNLGFPTHLDSGDARSGFAFHNYASKVDQFAKAVDTTLPAGQPPLSGRLAPLLGGTDADKEARVFGNALARVEATGEALLMTEFGGLDAPDPAGRLVERMADAADRDMIPWIYWRFPVPADSTAASWQSVRDVLVRPYPQAIAGTPTRWRFDPATQRFELRYATRPAGPTLRPGALTQIFVPDYRYPHGYRARVTGGTVASAPNARALLVAARPDAAEVVVEVTPAP